MGCGTSSHVSGGAPPSPAKETSSFDSINEVPTTKELKAPGLAGMRMSSRPSDAKSDAAMAAMARSVKAKCGYVPVFYIKSIFDKHDKDTSGLLEVGELEKVLEELNEDVDTELLALGMQRGNDSKVDFDQFLKWFSNTHLPHVIRNVFEAYDNNKDGSLSTGELPKLLRDLAEDCDEASCNKAMERLDTNRNGRVEFEEFSAYFRDSWAKERLMDTFRAFDLDQSDSLDRGELNTMLKTLGCPVNPAYIEDIFKKLDTAKDNKVSFAEFVKYSSLIDTHQIV